MIRIKNHPHPQTFHENPSYSALSCSSGIMEFFMIISRTDIIHLSFSRKAHQRAVLRIAELRAGAAPGPLVDAARVCEEMIGQLFDPEGKKPEPDFAGNPFLRSATPFQQKVWRLIGTIRPGETMTYGELASGVGSPGAARAAGQACNRNPLALIIPCHRVVGASGPGGFAGDLAIKLALLKIEKKMGHQEPVRAAPA